MKTCRFCRQEVCGCGAREYIESSQKIERGSPFAYNGYIVWWLRRIGDWIDFRFYLGDRLVDIIQISEREYRRFVPEHEDGMSFIWKLFEVSQGSEKVARVVEANNVKPRRFLITLEPDPEEERLKAMSETEFIRQFEKAQA